MRTLRLNFEFNKLSTRNTVAGQINSLKARADEDGVIRGRGIQIKAVFDNPTASSYGIAIDLLKAFEYPVYSRHENIVESEEFLGDVERLFATVGIDINKLRVKREFI